MQSPRIVWRRPRELPGVSADAPPYTSAVRDAILQVGIPSMEDATSPKDDAIGLLKLAAEVEHSLMVQYLYASQSLRAAPARTVAHIAVQEMGHLITVQNLLLAITGVTAENLPASLHLGRDSLRRASDRNPLPLTLEKVNHTLLAKFVVVERPAEIVDATVRARVEALEQEAAAGGAQPHPVYALYAAIRWLFQPTDDAAGDVALDVGLGLRPGWHLSKQDFAAPEIIDRFASNPTEWHSVPDLIVAIAHNHAEALTAIDAITAQGEGIPDSVDSHFAKYLQLLDKFEAGAVPVKDLPRTPFVAGQPTPEDAFPNEITNAYTRLWAQLFNVQYECLLVRIAWGVSQPQGDPSRSAMIDLVIDGMNRVIQPLAKDLAERVLNDTLPMKAGPPYGLADDTLPASRAGFGDRFRSLRERQAIVVTAIQKAIEFETDTSGKLRLEDIVRVDTAFAQYVPEGSVRMNYAIYPPIGFARLGNSPDGYFIGPERAGSRGVELQPDGTEAPVGSFKDANFRMKRQAARFHLFEVPTDGTPPRPAKLPAGAVVRWKVRMANKKDAIVRPPSPPDQPRKVTMDPARQDRLISATAEVEGASANSSPLDGTYRGVAVNLGNVRTDRDQNLIVLGGSGRSETLSTPPAPIGGSFYNNPDWFDDVGDGPVTATVTIPGANPVEATPAWVIVGPPDFSPNTLGVVTLYDVVRQVALDEGWVPPRARPYFDTDIRPMIERASDLRLVSESSVWKLISRDWARLGSVDPANAGLRAETARLVREVENVLQSFELREWQHAALDAWAEGKFETGAAPGLGLREELTRAALDGTVGQGFYPGIEAGINMTDAAMYVQNPFEFRFRTGALEPGDMTAHMAHPWQADFLKCGSGWWPAQRPNHAPQPNGPERPWLRPTMDHRTLVKEVMKLGVISEAAGGQVIEQGRDPSLGN